MEQQLTNCATWPSTAPKLHHHLLRRNTHRIDFPNVPLQNRFNHKKTINTLNRRTRGFPNAPSVLPVTAASKGGGGAGTDVAETAVVDRPPKVRRFQVSQGHPAPFGATTGNGGVNFAVNSGNAVFVTLCLITLSDLEQVISNYKFSDNLLLIFSNFSDNLLRRIRFS